MSVEHQFCTFSVDGLFFGVEVYRVQEVIRYQEMTPVPLAPPVVKGLINLRGQIVLAIDVRRALGLDLRDLQAQGSIAFDHGHRKNGRFKRDGRLTTHIKQQPSQHQPRKKEVASWEAKPPTAIEFVTPPAAAP